MIPSPPSGLDHLGHNLLWDPPAIMTAGKRWTCRRCGRVALIYGANLYGSATTVGCDR